MRGHSARPKPRATTHFVKAQRMIELLPARCNTVRLVAPDTEELSA